MEIILSDVEKGWLAGIIDGEGYLGLHKRKYNFKSSYLKQRQFLWEPILKISNTNLDLIKYAHGICKGGSVYGRPQKIKEGKVYRKCYELSLWSDTLRQILPKIIPILTAKKGEAILLLKSLELIDNYKRYHILHDNTLEEIRLQLHFLKNGG